MTILERYKKQRGISSGRLKNPSSRPKETLNEDLLDNYIESKMQIREKLEHIRSLEETERVWIEEIAEEFAKQIQDCFK